MPNQPFSGDSLAQLGGQAARTGGRYAASPAVISAIRDAASQTGTRFETLMASAAIESGLNPSAKASSSSATGLFQFVDQTWLAAVKRSGASHGLAAQAASIVRRGGQLTVDDPATRQEILDLRKDPKIAAAMAGDHLKDLSSQLTQSLGRVPDVAETYMGHFLGAGGAAQMLRAMDATPTRAAADVLPDAARANPAMFAGQTVAQFVSKVKGRVSQAYADLGMPAPQGPLQISGAGYAAVSSDAGSDGWGSGTPSRISTAPERMMLASLSQVFTKLDKGLGAQRNDVGRSQPNGVVASLDTTDGATSTYATPGI